MVFEHDSIPLYIIEKQAADVKYSLLTLWLFLKQMDISVRNNNAIKCNEISRLLLYC